MDIVTRQYFGRGLTVKEFTDHFEYRNLKLIGVQLDDIQNIEMIIENYYYIIEGEYIFYNGLFSIQLNKPTIIYNHRLERGLSHAYSFGFYKHFDYVRALINYKNRQTKNFDKLQAYEFENYVSMEYAFYPKCNRNLNALYNEGIKKQNWFDNKILNAIDEHNLLFLKFLDKLNDKFQLDSESLIEKVETVRNVNEKGKYLEILISKLFSSINGFKVTQRVLTATEELDLFVMNDSKEEFWKKESQVILVECKNWSTKVGKNELVSFYSKLENRFNRTKIGFFVSWNGFTKAFNNEMIRQSKSDILVIPLTGKDIRASTNSNDFELLLKKKWVETVNK